MTAPKRRFRGFRTRHRWPTREHEHMPDDDLPKIGAPATRALASIGVTRLADVADRSESELLRLHGFGPRALRILKEALAANGLSMRP
jgi:predicted flap endonuclease-1-like 5' DNA nuclease